MTEKLVDRKKRESDAMKGRTSDKTVSVETLAAQSHGMIEVKHGN